MNLKKTITVFTAFLITASLLTGCGNSRSVEETTTSDGRIFSSDSSAYKGDIDSDTLLSYADIQDAKVTLPKDYKEMKVVLSQYYEPISDGVFTYEDNVLAGTPGYESTEKKIVARGDIVDIDYEGKIDGKAFEGGSAKGAKITIGSNSMVSGFEEGMIGYKVGETVTLNLTLPEDYPDSKYAGKPAIYTVKINRIVRAVTMSRENLTDTFVKENFESKYGVSTVKDFEKKMEEEYKNSLAEQKYNAVSAEVMEQLVDESKIEADNSEMEKTVGKRMGYVRKQAEQLGMSYEDYASTYYGSEENLKASVQEAVKQELVLQQVIKENKIGIRKKDFKKYVAGYLKSYQMTDKQALYDMFGGEQAMMFNFAENQAVSYLTARANVSVSGESSTQVE